MIERIRKLLKKREIKEQEELIKILKRPENQRRRLATKFAMNKVRTK